MALYMGQISSVKVLKGKERDQINTHLAQANLSGSQPTSGKFLCFGDDNQAVRGLMQLLGCDDSYANEIIENGEKTMGQEVAALTHRKGDPQDWFHTPRRTAAHSWDWNDWVPDKKEVVDHFDYVVNQKSSEKEYPNGTRDQGRNGVTLQHFLDHEICQKAGLRREHVIALRLYTTVVYKYINAPLRNQKLYRDDRHPLAAVVFYIFQGIKMLRACAADIKGEIALWRAVKNVQASATFLNKGGTELAPMSTTKKLDVALRYLRGMTLNQGAVLFRIIVTNKLNIGADLAWLSAFQEEAEYLYPPMTYLEVVRQYMRDANGEELNTKEPRQEIIHAPGTNGVGVQVIEMQPNLSADDGINMKGTKEISGFEKGQRIWVMLKNELCHGEVIEVSPTSGVKIRYHNGSTMEYIPAQLQQMVQEGTKERNRMLDKERKQRQAAENARTEAELRKEAAKKKRAIAEKKAREARIKAELERSPGEMKIDVSEFENKSATE